jgi:D-alanine-D-alanine ligase
MPETTLRKSPAECAAEFEEEIEANSMDSENDRKKGIFSNTSETVQVFEGL